MYLAHLFVQCRSVTHVECAPQQVALNPLLLCCGLHSSTRDGLHDDIEDLENRLTEVTRQRERMRALNARLQAENTALKEGRSINTPGSKKEEKSSPQ